MRIDALMFYAIDKKRLDDSASGTLGTTSTLSGADIGTHRQDCMY